MWKENTGKHGSAIPLVTLLQHNRYSYRVPVFQIRLDSKNLVDWICTSYR